MELDQSLLQEIIEVAGTPGALKQVLGAFDVQVKNNQIRVSDFERVFGGIELTDREKIRLWADFQIWSNGKSPYDIPLNSQTQVSVADWISERVPPSRKKLVEQWICRIRDLDPMADRT